jgi:hypothetical protein
MFASYLASAIDAAHPSQLDPISRDLWRAHGAGSLSDTEAQSLAEALEARRPLYRDRHPVTWGTPPQRRLSIFPQRRPQHARKHPKRIDRRRRLASSGPMPPQLAAAWTTGELAVLRIVADETSHGTSVCDRSLGEIAARAGVCRSLAQATLRRAQAAGLVMIEERRRRGQKNLPNAVRIVSPEWRMWLQRGPRTGSRNPDPTDTDSYLKGKSRIQKTRRKGSEEKEWAVRPVPPD